MLVRSFVAFLLIAVAAGAIVACTGAEDSTPDPIVPTATLTLTASPGPTETPPASGTPSDSEPRRTGDAALDRIIEAIEERDMVTLSSLVRYQEVGCTHADGAAGPPKCEEGIKEGSPLRVFPVASCEGHWNERATQLIGFIAHSAQGLYAAVEPSGDTTLGGEWPAADYFLLFHLDQFERQLIGRLHVAEGKIGAYWAACGAGGSPERLLDAGVEGGVEVTAGPWADPAPVKTAAPSTGIVAVDGILAAVARYEWAALIEAAERARQELPDVACVAVATVPGDIECEAAKGEQPSDPVSVFPVAYCEGSLVRDPGVPLSAFLDQVPQLHAVVEAPSEPPQSSLYRHGAYWIVYELQNPAGDAERGVRLHVTAEGYLTAIWYGCSPTLAQLVQWNGEPLPEIEVRR